MDKYQIPFIIVGVLLAGGWGISYYFYQVYKKRISENVIWMPGILRMSTCNCDDIVATPFGRMFGRSNAFWGQWYYGIVIIMILIQLLSKLYLINILLLLITLAVFQTLYLLWGLYTLKVICRPCLGIHTINILSFILLLASKYIL